MLVSGSYLLPNVPKKPYCSPVLGPQTVAAVATSTGNGIIVSNRPFVVVPLAQKKQRKKQHVHLMNGTYQNMCPQNCKSIS